VHLIGKNNFVIKIKLILCVLIEKLNHVNMKSLFCFLLFSAFVFTPRLIAQNNETVFSKEFESEVADFDRFANGYWLIGETHTPTPGLIFEDGLLIRIFDSLCHEIKQIPIIPLDTAEKQSIHKTLVLSDTSFLVEYGSGDCDAYPYSVFFDARDTSSQLLWRKKLQHSSISSTITLSPDGHILRMGEGFIEKFNVATGDLIWAY
jgi:hypothetical protein